MYAEVACRVETRESGGDKALGVHAGMQLFVRRSESCLPGRWRFASFCSGLRSIVVSRRHGINLPGYLFNIPTAEILCSSHVQI